MKIFLSGNLPSTTFLDNVDNKYLGFFPSYYYRSQTERILERYPTHAHIVDSGAHTFFSEEGIVSVSTHKTQKKDRDVDLYFSNYLNWVEKNYNSFSYFVELDLQEIYGMSKILEWRQEIARRGLLDKLITCFHLGDTDEDLDRILDYPSKYIALQGLRLGEKPIDYLSIIKKAYDHQVKVHGFAFTRVKLLRDLPFYSVDSSTWQIGSIYGAFGSWEGYRLKMHFRKNIIDLGKNGIAGLGVPPILVQKESPPRRKVLCRGISRRI